jgi:uncharacterized protein with PIN domain
MHNPNVAFLDDLRCLETRPSLVWKWLSILDNDKVLQHAIKRRPSGLSQVTIGDAVNEQWYCRLCRTAIESGHDPLIYENRIEEFAFYDFKQERPRQTLQSCDWCAVSLELASRKLSARLCNSLEHPVTHVVGIWVCNSCHLYYRANGHFENLPTIKRISADERGVSVSPIIERCLGCRLNGLNWSLKRPSYVSAHYRRGGTCTWPEDEEYDRLLGLATAVQKNKMLMAERGGKGRSATETRKASWAHQQTDKATSAKKRPESSG